MEKILSNYDDKDESTQQMEELIQGNHDLLALNESLKSEIMAL